MRDVWRVLELREWHLCCRMIYWRQCKVWTEGRWVLRQRQKLGGFCSNLGARWQGLNLGYGSEKTKGMPRSQLEFVCVHIHRQGMQKRWDTTADLETKMRLYLYLLWEVGGKNHCSWSQERTKNIFVGAKSIDCGAGSGHCVNYHNRCENERREWRKSEILAIP